MPVHVACLDIGRLFHKVPGKSIEFVLDQRWDAILIQNTYRELVENIEFQKRWPVRDFEAMTNQFKRGGLREEVGIGIFTTLPIISRSSHAFVRHLLPVGTLTLDAVTLDEDGNANAKDLARLREQESRLVVFVELLLPGEHVLKIGTVHGAWRPRGEVDASLRRDVRKFCNVVANEPGDFVIAGNFSAACGGEIYKMFLGGGLRDVLPTSIDNTIDYGVKGGNPFPLVVDGIYAKGNVPVTNVELHAGVSDHFGISFVLS